MRPTAELTAEHNAIKRMLRILEQVARRLEAGQAVDAADLEQSVEFIRGFADRCHHGKEEDLLFRALEEAGLSRESGPIAVMLSEHGLGRDYVKDMAGAIPGYRAGDRGAAASFAEKARGYAALLEQHIHKEDNILYPLAERMLSVQKQEELLAAFAQVERERVGPGQHEAYHALLDRLEALYLK